MIIACPIALLVLIMNSAATMAIEDLIDAHIIIDGAEATEYPAEPQKDERTGKEVTTKYVEVVSGAEFSLSGHNFTTISIWSRECFGNESLHRRALLRWCSMGKLSA